MTAKNDRGALDAFTKGHDPGEIMERVEYLDDLGMIEAAVDHPDPYVRYGLARNANVGDEVLARLADDADRGVRMFVAENWAASADLHLAMAREETDPDVLHALAGSDRLAVQVAVATNPATVGEDLAQLAAGAPSVRIVAFTNPQMPEDELAAAVTDPSAAVREAAASNPALSIEQVEELAKDGDASVRQAVTYTHGNKAARVVVAAAGTVVETVGDVGRWTSALHGAAAHAVSGAREGVHAADAAYMRHGNVTAAGTITHLLAEFDTGLDAILARATAAVRSAEPEKTLAAEIENVQALIREQHPVWMEAVAVEEAYARDTTPERLEELAAEGSVRVRASVARNPRTPEHVRSELLADEDIGVAAAARTTEALLASREARAAMPAPEHTSDVPVQER